MKRTEIDRILSSGTPREKILLYLSSYAEKATEKEEIETLFMRAVFPKDLKRGRRADPIKLTEEEELQLRDAIYTNKKSIATYQRLRGLNSVFLYYMERFKVDLVRLQAIGFAIAIYKPRELEEGAEPVMDQIKVFFSEQPAKKKEQINKDRWYTAETFIHLATISASECKYTLEVFKAILSTDLPLKPYRSWVYQQEVVVKEIVEGIYRQTSARADYPVDSPPIRLYEDIEIEINPEDIEDFKNSSL